MFVVSSCAQDNSSDEFCSHFGSKAVSAVFVLQLLAMLGGWVNLVVVAVSSENGFCLENVHQQRFATPSSLDEAELRTPVNNIEYFPPNFEGLVLGCIDADFCK